MNVCMVLPIYRHTSTCGQLLDAAAKNDLFCVMIDDGNSTADAEFIAKQALQRRGRAVVIRLDKNQGKGAAVQAGCQKAAQLGYSHILQIDADGQHEQRDIPRFLKMARQFPQAVIVGQPHFDKTQPLSRRLGRYLTHVWIWINTLSLDIKDSMCGFRVYPLGVLLDVWKYQRVGSRMDFDPAILVRLHWRGIAVKNLKTSVTYPAEGVSSFLPLLDNWLITRMHTLLFFGMLIRLPRLLWRKLNPKI